jgi:DNA-binding response OmpR family regulator
VPHVLVIDDDRSVGRAIQIALSLQGYDAEFVPDAHAGLQAFASFKFDVMMVDIFMPGMDGIELIKHVRAQAPEVPIVAMSGFSFRSCMAPGPDVLGMALKLGATSCLRKPFASDQLTAAIYSVLNPERSRDGMATDRGTSITR